MANEIIINVCEYGEDHRMAFLDGWKAAGGPDMDPYDYEDDFYEEDDNYDGNAVCLQYPWHWRKTITVPAEASTPFAAGAAWYEINRDKIPVEMYED